MDGDQYKKIGWKRIISVGRVTFSKLSSYMVLPKSVTI